MAGSKKDSILIEWKEILHKGHIHFQFLQVLDLTFSVSQHWTLLWKAINILFY